jgi:adenylylsulfate kinase
MSVRAVLLVGPVGSGKTAIATELGELLGARGLPVAVIDLDWLGWFHAAPGGPSPDELIAENLGAVWPRFRSAGARYLALARALTTSDQLRALRDALDGVDLMVALVRAPDAVIAARLGRRDQGAVLREHLVQAAAMRRALQDAHLEDLVVDNEHGSANEAARSLLERLGW